uniref:Poly [ADP-ribose] polymerase n=1 Tax=Amphiprion ocellaris TaxID=80972 RepID=A0A3Q1B1B8_AMPOC
MQPPLPPEAVRELVCSCLHRDPVAADLRCSLFVAADFEELLADVSSLPGVRELVRLRPGEGDQHLALTHWILSSKSFAVKTLQKDEYAKLCNLTENEGISAPVPNFLFELDRLENFHSIIHNGLHCHLNKNSVFGEGTYLTSDLSMAVLYSPHSSSWQESILGPQLSCVALCEVIDHPDVKCQVKKKDSEIIDRQRSRAKNSEGGNVPQKYFIVTNNQLLRVKYLLVYSQRRHLSSITNFLLYRRILRYIGIFINGGVFCGKRSIF